MDRRDFLSALAAFAVAGGCQSAASMARRGAVSEAEADLRSQMLLGYFDCAAAAGLDGGAALVAAEGSAVSEDSLFELASVSKLFTAAICARLHAQGRLDVDRPVFGNASLRDLAAHTSGYTDSWMGKAGVFGAKWPFADDAAYESAVLSIKPSYARREKIVYACTNMILMGFILERKLGIGLDEAARSLVWRPLGMNSTTWRNVPPDDSRLVRMYTKGPRPLGTKGDENARNFTRPIGNAGVFSSLRDIRKFAADMVSREVFEPEFYKLLLSSSAEWKGRRRSFGWDMSPDAIPPGWSDGTVCHSGYTGQYIAVDPLAGRAAVVLTNLKSEDRLERAKSYAGRKRVAAIIG